MAAVESSKRILLKNILYLTDFSQASEVALPFAVEIARAYGAKVFAAHILVPSAVSCIALESTAAGIEWQEESAVADMQRAEAQLVGLPHETIVERGTEVWAPVGQLLKEHQIDLVVLGTHGRTGLQKVLLGSAAEEIFRRSLVPVITIGPSVRTGAHNDARFRRVLLATDFTTASEAAVPYAISLAQENQARIILLHVFPKPGHVGEHRVEAMSVAEAMYQLHDLVPKDAELWCRPEALVRYGDPGEEILAAAKERGADLIVLGIRGTPIHPAMATHLVRATAYKVVSSAECPVLTVRN